MDETPQETINRLRQRVMDLGASLSERHETVREVLAEKHSLFIPLANLITAIEAGNTADVAKYVQQGKAAIKALPRFDLNDQPESPDKP